MPDSGFFLVIEGIDAAGTTTQVSNIADTLNAQYSDDPAYPTPAVHTTAEPTEGPIGGTIRTALGGRLDLDDTSLALLFAADRVDHGNTTIKPLLEDGHIVISDRYYLSSFAYQQTADGLDLDWVRTINKQAVTPDLTVFLDISPEESIRRMADGRPDAVKEKFEQKDQLESVRQNYHQAIDILVNDGERIVSIDGSQSETAVHSEIIDIIQAITDE
jgi:dTMP kinase